MNFTVYKDRFDPEYLRHLAELLGDLDRLCEYAAAPEKDRIFKVGEKFKKGIQIDFCGLAATTLLGVSIRGETQSEERMLVGRNLANLLSTDTTKKLNDAGFYLKIRFIFSYVYSAFAKSMIEAESSLSRPRVFNREGYRKIDYSFTIQSEISQQLIERSSLYQSQVESLSRIARIVFENPSLVMSTPESSENSLQVRFSTIAMPVCLLIVNDTAYFDPYLYSQEGQEKGVHNLFYHCPIQTFDSKRPGEENYVKYLSNHFDYQWNNEITMLCRDGTMFDLHTNYKGLSEIRKPEQLVFDQKERRIKDHLRRKDKAWEPNQQEIDKWKTHLTRKLNIYLGQVNIGTNPPAKDPDLTRQVELRTSLEIGMRGVYYYFKMIIPAEDVVIEYFRPNPEWIFKVFLHAALALNADAIPTLAVMNREGRRIFGIILRALRNIGRKNGQEYEITVDFMHRHIFDPNNYYMLIMDKSRLQIHEDPIWKKLMGEMTYDGPAGKKYYIGSFDR